MKTKGNDLDKIRYIINKMNSKYYFDIKDCVWRNAKQPFTS